MPFFTKKTRRTANGNGTTSEQNTAYNGLSAVQIKKATRTRSSFGWFTSFCLFVTIIFLILVEIGNTYNKPVLRNIWFLKLNLSNIVPTTVPNAVLINSIAQTLGLADFYQVGLWNYCQGLTQGVTSCTKPQTLYYFNPVAIIADQLIAGAVVTLPEELSTILNIIQVASHWMFGLFLAGACLSFILMFAMHSTVYSRWIAFVLTILTFFNALFIAAASVIGTVMFIIMRNVFETNTDVNIGAEIGVAMFALMWIASAFAIIAFCFQLGMCCCCASRRDVRTGRKMGSKKAYSQGSLEK